MPWHCDADVQEAVRRFHDTYAKQPEHEMTEAMRYHEEFLTKIRNILQKKNICTRLEFSGSSYEGLKTPGELEFDVMVVLSNTQHATTQKVRPGFSKIVCRSSDNPVVPDSSSSIPPAKVLARFHGELQKILNAQNASNVRLRSHGPAVQTDVYKDDGSLWYSVDMVPTFEIDDKLYVAKPFEEEVAELWRLSYTPDEKNALKTIDRWSGCRRECVRVLKVLRDNENNLRCISSYILKTTLFLCDKKYATWDRRQIGACVLLLLTELQAAMERGVLYNHLIPGLDLLSKLSEATKQNVSYRLKRLITSKSEFMSVVRVSRNEAHEDESSGSYCNIL